ncbi:MAG TPA: 7-cyano-7-deazaguanine synthase QueC [Candidatus Sulfotelmatobacter sp.]|nr:7-cyano-7-deazaguanine synthase QueC [Candidatus Sulfotelmatobacter sp.]
MKRGVVLLSGGLDSSTCLAWARREGFECHALAVDYGQRHRVELDAAKRVAAAMGAASYRVVAVDLRAIGGSALTGAIAVPRDRDERAMGADIPVTYVPARNTVLLALALGLAETLASHDLVAGMNALDYSGYPDCRPEFVRAFEQVAKLGTRAGVEGAEFHVHTPLMALDKAGIIRLGLSLGVDYALTHSCYDPAPDGAACGRCDACQLRRKGFREAGAADPTRYAE